MCFEQRRYFSPYVVYSSRLLGREVKALNKCLSLLLTRKWNNHYSVTCGYVNVRMSVEIMQASHLYIHGSHVPFHHASIKIARWENSAGLKLMRTQQYTRTEQLINTDRFITVVLRRRFSYLSSTNLNIVCLTPTRTTTYAPRDLSFFAPN